MSELVRDPVYRNFLTTMPRLPEIMADKARAKSPPWVVYVQVKPEGPWGKREFWKYKKALKFFSHAVMKVKVHDAALNCKRYGFEPPGKLVRVKGRYVEVKGKKQQVTKFIPWKPQTELLLDQPEHHWCKYCRRPTIFKYFSKHKRLGAVTSDVPRCCICGASARIALSANDRMFGRV